MTGVERLAATMRGAPADRIPVFCNMLDQGARELGMPLREYYARGEHVAEGQLRMRERLGYDNVWGLFYVGKEAELLGCRSIRFAHDGPPNVEHLVIEGDGDIARFEVPADITELPAFEEQRNCMHALRREVGGANVICVYVTATPTLPALLMGMDRWMELLLMGDPGLCGELLAKCHQFVVQEITALRDLGADVVVYSNPMGSTEFVPRKVVTERVLPWVERDVGAVGPDGVVYYAGTARMRDVIAETRDRTGLGAWYLSPLDDVAASKAVVGEAGLTCAPINDIRLIAWSAGEAREEVRRILEAGMPGGPFLFGTGVMPYAIPDDTVRAMLEAAYEFGRCDGDPMP